MAGIQYQKEGHGKFRDCVTFCKNGKFIFERFCYGEAAGSVCTLWANGYEENKIKWDYSGSNYTGKTDAPVELTGHQEDNLQFDEKSTFWKPVKERKTIPEAGLSRLAMLFHIS